jgi:hypothetical protein
MSRRHHLHEFSQNIAYGVDGKIFLEKLFTTKFQMFSQNILSGLADKTTKIHNG